MPEGLPKGQIHTHAHTHTQKHIIVIYVQVSLDKLTNTRVHTHIVQIMSGRIISQIEVHIYRDMHNYGSGYCKKHIDLCNIKSRRDPFALLT